ncbi:TrmB family transcriptional regulator [Lentzea atacamensis]|uniref:TrmB family transcriptional regulator n=1 Tax=Lentzea atacamensis TaxID=531938 RepID=A0A316HMT4_9PSEU|nr:MarR family transcriptional regulator [Lentzea atacamensis]PWK81456.1 TrmB family transcriptional regulator [Lentzea atacamensis]RAS70603.1 TrmB family transcriptional regulator [Lentzea atacamensis]
MTGETERKRAARKDAAEHLALTLAGAGMQRMAARVLAAFLFTDEPSLTAGDLVAELGASAGSVSGAVKTVMQMGLIERVAAPGSRREHYRMRDRAWTTLYGRQHAPIDDILSAVARGVATVEPGPARERLIYMRDFYEFLLGEVPSLIERFEQRRAGPRP